MYLHMSTIRTTILLPELLFQEAKISAVKQNTTLTQLISKGLLLVLGKEEVSHKKSFSEYLKTFTPPVKPITQDEQDTRYKQAILKKHG